MFKYDAPLSVKTASEKAPLAFSLRLEAVVRDVGPESVSHDYDVAARTLDGVVAAVGVVVLLKVCDQDCGLAVLAGGALVEASLLGGGIHSRDSLVAVEVGAVDRSVFAVSLVVGHDEASGSNVVAGRVRALDLEAIELRGDGVGLAEPLWVVDERLPVDGALGLVFEGAVEAGGAEGVAAEAGNGLAEWSVADRAEEGVIDG